MLMLSPFANADMDNVCNIKTTWSINDFLSKDIENKIKEAGCKRNNILVLDIPYDGATNNMSLLYASALWCRHDRNEQIVLDVLRCVLYDTKPRKILE